MIPAATILLALLRSATIVNAWTVYNIEDFGATSGKDSTAAIHAALAAASEQRDGAEVLVPPNGNYFTSPMNITTNVVLRVDGNLTGLRDAEEYPVVDLLPSYGRDLSYEDLDAGGGLPSHSRRHHPLIWSVNSTNVTICGIVNIYWRFGKSLLFNLQ